MIIGIGKSLEVMNCNLCGSALDEAFSLVLPDIPFTWDSVSVSCHWAATYTGTDGLILADNISLVHEPITVVGVEYLCPFSTCSCSTFSSFNLKSTVTKYL